MAEHGNQQQVEVGEHRGPPDGRRRDIGTADFDLLPNFSRRRQAHASAFAISPTCPPTVPKPRAGPTSAPCLGALVLAVSLGLDPTDLAVICAYAAGMITANNPPRGRSRAVESII